jgi:hypothetical protein
MKQKPTHKVLDNISIENAKIGFKNFSGKQTDYNPPGRKNFCVFFDEELGKKLEADGWNIRWTRPRSEEDDSVPFLPVAVSFDNIPPKIVLITSRGQTLLNSNTVNELDWAEIKNVDLVIRPYNWAVNGKGGVKAYVRSMYVTIDEDEFAEKYSHLPSDRNSSPSFEGDEE